MNKTTALVTTHAHSLEPANMSEAMSIAVDLAKSGLFQHLPNAGAVFAVLAKGRELGLPMMAALTEINVIKGKVSLSAAALVAVCVSKPDVCEYFTHVESDERHAVYKTKRKNSDEVRHTFTMDDAQRMGLAGNDNYKKQPATMLRARAASALGRMVYPDLLAGCYTPDEIEHIEQVPMDATSQPQPALPPKPETTDVERAFAFIREATDRKRVEAVIKRARRAAAGYVEKGKDYPPDHAMAAALGDLETLAASRMAELPAEVG